MLQPLHPHAGVVKQAWKGVELTFSAGSRLAFLQERDGANCYTGSRWGLFSAGKGWGYIFMQKKGGASYRKEAGLALYTGRGG